MRPRQPAPRCPKPPLPCLWLFTDERVADAILLTSIQALPRGSGIVFRHYRTPEAARRALYERIRTVARRRRLVLLLAGTARDAAAWRADGVHLGRNARGLGQRGRGVRTAAAHDAGELRRAQRAGVDLVFLSPVFATRSHPDVRPLGAVRFGLIAGGAKSPVAALGGMTPARYRQLRALGASGWAAIDGLTRAAGPSAPRLTERQCDGF